MPDSTTTTDSITVDATVMDDYNAVNGGVKPSARATERGVTTSTVSANVKRVREALARGATVNVSNGGTVTSTGAPTVPDIDPHAIADSMVMGASMVTRALESVTDESDALRKRATDTIARATEQAATLNATADRLIADATPRIDAGAAAFGFDIDAWRAAVDTARADAAKPATPDSKPDAS